MSDPNMQVATAESFRTLGRRCGMVFAAVVCGTLLMVGASYAPLPNRALSIALVLAGACFNAALVAGYLMHLVSERKMIIALLAFTGFFFAALMALTVWAAYDLPESLTY